MPNRISRRRAIALVSLGLVSSGGKAGAQGAIRRPQPNFERPPLPPGIPTNPRDLVVKDFGSWRVTSIANYSNAWIPAERVKVRRGGKPGRLVGGGMRPVSEGLPIRDAQGNLIKPPAAPGNASNDSAQRLLIGGQGELKIEYWSGGKGYSGTFRLATTSNEQGSLPVKIVIDGKQVRSLNVSQFADVSATDLFGPGLKALPGVKNFKATADFDGATYTIYEVDLEGSADALKHMRLIPDYNYNVRHMGNQPNGNDPNQSGKCFLTTACCGVMGRADDCFELRALRRFRDDVMLASAGGRRDVDDYYQMAPRILDTMQRRGETHRLRAVYFGTILPCAILAKLGFNKPTRRLYTRMMRRLGARYAP